MIIYKITNNINEKIYIGQTINSIEHRFRQHCQNKSKYSLVYNSIKKHGKENFTIEQIDSALSLDEINEKEVYWIKFFDSTNRKFGYNLRTGGNNSIPSEESKLKMSLSHIGKSPANKGKPHSDEAKLKMSLAKLGKPSAKKDFSCSPETRKKISETNKGQKAWNKGVSPNIETKLKMSLSKKGKAALNKQQCIVIKDGNEIVFNSMTEVANFLGYSVALISKIISNKNGIHRDFMLRRI